MQFFDVRSSVEIPNLPAESFDRKLVGALNHYNIKFEKLNKGKLIFRTSFFQFTELKYRRLIFRGISSGEVEFLNEDENLIVKFNLSFMPTRICITIFALAMVVISGFQKDYVSLIFGAWIVILYFVARDSIRYKFRKWFSRFTK